ncbi:MAG: hypothetical protein PVI75_04595 [Gammaproteobacteria bacterium]|jgi:hypothetical protein
MGLEVIKETRTAVKNFGKKTIPGYMKSCSKLANELTRFIERAKELFTNPSDEINEDLSAYNEKADRAIRSLEVETATTTTAPEQVAQR